jgi:hypothetical protein
MPGMRDTDKREDSGIQETLHQTTAGAHISTSCAVAWYTAYNNILSIIQMGTAVFIMKGFIFFSFLG